MNGVVTKGGFEALLGAEIYGNVSSIGALNSHLALLHGWVLSGSTLEAYDPKLGVSRLSGPDEFLQWQQHWFPSATVRAR